MTTKILTKLKYLLIAVPIALLFAGLLSSPYKVFAKDDTIDTFIKLSRVSDEDIKEKQDARDKAVAEASTYATTASTLRTEAGTLRGDLEELNGLSEEQRAQYEELSEQLAAALLAKADALDTYLAAQENLETTRLMFSNRISVMFEYQNKSTLEVLLESESIAGFFTNMELISLIADADNQAVDQMQIALDDAELQSELALQQAEDMQTNADQCASLLKELEDRIGVTTEALDNVELQISAAEQKEAELNAYAATLDSEIKKLQEQREAEQAAAAAQSQSQSSGSSSTATTTTTTTTTSSGGGNHGTVQWPTWCTWITSPYGERVHPIYKTTRFHSGIDIGAGYGDTVMAAKGGTVITVDYPYPGQNTGGSGYGNYVVIDHGNGLSTLYGHMRSINVSVGDYVNAGTAIGEVGSTGTSDGPHLHFEVRVYGSTVNPTDYLP